MDFSEFWCLNDEKKNESKTEICYAWNCWKWCGCVYMCVWEGREKYWLCVVCVRRLKKRRRGNSLEVEIGSKFGWYSCCLVLGRYTCFRYLLFIFCLKYKLDNISFFLSFFFCNNRYYRTWKFVFDLSYLIIRYLSVELIMIDKQDTRVWLYFTKSEILFIYLFLIQARA